MMVSWAARAVEIGVPQLGIWVGRELGELLVGYSSRRGTLVAGWQWPRLLSTAGMGGT